MALQYARPRCVSTESPCSTSYRVVPQRVVHQRHQRQCVWGASAQQHTSRSLIVRSAAERDDDEVPTSFELAQRVDKQKPLVKIPFGWSFLSIAKVPMTWNNGDIWTCEVELQAGQRVEYKYVILEEQDWTKLEDQDAQGLVEITYRTGSDPGRPPDVQIIQKQMAIVAWQPGPNRTLQVPSESELQQLKPGDCLERIPPRANQKLPYSTTGKLPTPTRQDPFEGTWEVLTMEDGGRPLLDRHDVWGWTGPGGSASRNPIRGINFGGTG